jgi:hypothetical protein
MDLQLFATQECVQQALLCLFKIDGTANPPDALSKPLYRILHRYHFGRLMRYYGSPQTTITLLVDCLGFSYSTSICTFIIFLHFVRNKISHPFSTPKTPASSFGEPVDGISLECGECAPPGPHAHTCQQTGLPHNPQALNPLHPRHRPHTPHTGIAAYRKLFVS